MLLHNYSNGGYKVELYNDGTKIRTKVSDVLPTFPEQMDLKITDWCDGHCGWCHEDSLTTGKHGDVDAMLDLLRSLPPGVEIAIGGGDPLSHPDFPRLVRSLRSLGLVPSVTVNGKHYDRHAETLKELTSEGVLFGVGLSYAGKWPALDWDYPNKVVHLIAGVNHPTVALDIPAGQKVLILGYKNFRRGSHLLVSEETARWVRSNINSWWWRLGEVARLHKLSFDNLAITQLDPKRLFKDPATYDEYYMGEEGNFSMYVDGVKQEFSLCSYEKTRYSWSDYSGISSMFQQIRTGK